MNKRVSLSRIIAINWYGFRQILDTTGHTLIAGAYGTGKTALLDLMQYVLLGGQHWRPNRAAAGNARSRSLVSYCLCDTNTQRNGEAHYTRQNGVTFAALEFTWPLTDAQRRNGEPPRRETWGMRIEFASPTAEARTTWFGLPERLTWDHMAPDGEFLDEDSFRSWVRREHGRECLFSRQVDYLAEMGTAQHLYFEEKAFRRTLPKAIAFEPEENVERFIREFVLEATPIDVRDVKLAVSAYRETQNVLLTQEDEAAHLNLVCDHHQRFLEGHQQAALYRHLEKSLRLDQETEKLEKAQFELDSLQRSFATAREGLENARRRLDELTSLIEQTRLAVSNDPEAVKLEELKRQRAKLQNEVQILEAAQRSTREYLAAIRLRWSSWLKAGDALRERDERCTQLESPLQMDPAALEQLGHANAATGMEALSILCNRFQEIWSQASSILLDLKRAADDCRRRLQTLAAELERLSRNEQLGDCPVYRALREKLGDRVRQLGRLIEVKPDADRWWPALELVLGARRFVLVVGKDDYREALQLVKQTAPGREPESLLNPWEIDSLPKTRVDDSLADKVEVEDPLAREYVHHLLGEVAGVETVEDLDQSPAGRAITPDGILKQRPLRRRLMPANEVPLTLGIRGLERLRAERETEQVAARREFERLELLVNDFNSWLDQGKQSGLGTLPTNEARDFERLDTLKGEWRSLGETIELLATPEREERLEQLKNYEEERRELDRQSGRYQKDLESSLAQEKRLTEQVETGQRETKTLEEELLRLRGLLPASIGLPAIQAAADEIKAAVQSWTERISRAVRQAGEAEAKAESARIERDNARQTLIDSAHHPEAHKRHPHYRSDFDPRDETNDRWTARLQQLEEIELPKYRELAKERRRDWENRLKESVLDRLKERLDQSERDIRALRNYLSHAVGKYRYTITQRRDPAFQNIWSLIDTGFEPTDELLAGAETNATQEALEELMRAVDASGDLDERARRLLDYRCYHHYDIELQLRDDPTAPTISLSRSMRSLSGGENQAPFFISMLAAFRRVYDLGPDRATHMGLVVMDEAFSKLSGDGVEDCLQLAGNFQLQLLMAFPIDRLGIMAPYADTVIICRKEEKRDKNGYITRIDNIPQRITAAEAVDSIG